jgi:II/X family phage/plasmid replication protein
MDVHKPMFDTVAGKFESGPYFPKGESRNAWETRTRDFFDARLGVRQKTVAHTFNSSEARIAILGDGGLLRVEASLPKLIYGNNISSVIDPVPGLKLLGEFVADHVEGTFSDLIEMDYLRVDYCHNFRVGSTLPDYVDTLGKVSFLQHRRSTDGFGGVEWWGENGRRIRIYDKYKEILETEKRELPEARGTLRFEVQLRKKSGFLQRRTHNKRMTLRDALDPALGHHCLDEILTKMCLAHKFETRDAARSLLDALFGYRKATRLLGVVRRLETETMDDLKHSASRSTFYADKRDLRRLGLWPPSTSMKELPGLELPSLDQLLALTNIHVAGT